MSAEPKPNLWKRIASSAKQAKDLAWNEALGLFVVFALVGATGLVDWSISKSGNPDLPLSLEANATMGLLILGVFAVVYKMYTVRLGSKDGEPGD